MATKRGSIKQNKWTVSQEHLENFTVPRQGTKNSTSLLTSLTKQTTFRDATDGFPAKWRRRNERRNSRHYTDPGNASDWLMQISQTARPIRSTTQIWVATLHQYWIFRTRYSDVIWLGTFEIINRAQNPITAGKRTMSGWDDHLSFGFRVGHCHV